MEARIKELFDDARSTQQQLIESPEIMQKTQAAATMLIEALEGGHKVLLCGNGGSASDAQHIAGEIVGRFVRDREGWPAVALTTDTSIMTAVANDYGFDDVFRRQVEALGSKGDVLIAYSTSGNSGNVIKAIEEAKKQGMTTIGMTAVGGGKMHDLADINIEAPTKVTARAQECHALVGHVLCELVEAALSGTAKKAKE